MLKKNDLPKLFACQYITPDGRKKLQDELEYLWRKKRPEVTQAVAAAAAMGDRSENAEYIYGKKQLREIDKRIRFLRKRIEQLVVVDRTPADQSRIYFGAWVELEYEQGDILLYRIVGSDEFDLSRGWISINAPLARALLKKQVDDDVTISLPKRKLRVRVISIRYSI